MEGKEAILENIRANAASAAAALIAAAEAEKQERLNVVKAELAELEKKEQAKTETEAALIISRRNSVARLQASKVLLAAKQRLVDSVYASVLQRIHNMTDPVYRDFIGGYVVKYAQPGDTVILPERDKKLTKEYFEKLSEKHRLNLTVSDKTHGGDGVILSGKKCDKNLTLSALLADAREKTERTAAAKLF